MDLFDIQPQIANIEHGPEPSIRALLRYYYGQHIPANDVENLVNEYIAKFNEIASK